MIWTKSLNGDETSFQALQLLVASLRPHIFDDVYILWVDFNPDLSFINK